MTAPALPSSRPTRRLRRSLHAEDAGGRRARLDAMRARHEVQVAADLRRLLAIL